MYPRPLTLDAPVLDDVLHVVDRSAHVRTHPAAAARLGHVLAQEPLVFTSDAMQLRLGGTQNDEIDLSMVVSLLDFAFTDFETGVKFTAEFQGRTWSDSDGLLVCLQRAWQAGVPVLDGRWLAEVTPGQLAAIFTGNIRMPMLEERAHILNVAGRTLAERYDGRWCNFLDDCPDLLYADGEGTLERLVREFPRFDDVVEYEGQRVRIHKLAQLSLWGLHNAFGPSRRYHYRDIARLTAFADYIVPLGLQLAGVLEYTPELTARIQRGEIIERDSAEEIEIRAHTIYGVALVTEEINRRRPADAQVIMPQVDGRLWLAHHASREPHHLTVTPQY